MSYVPTNLTYEKVANQVTATVTLNAADPNSPVFLSVTYAPANFVASGAGSCVVPKNGTTGTFQFTLATNQGSGTLTVTVVPSGDSNPQDACVVHIPIV